MTRSVTVFAILFLFPVLESPQQPSQDQLNQTLVFENSRFKVSRFNIPAGGGGNSEARLYGLLLTKRSDGSSVGWTVPWPKLQGGESQYHDAIWVPGERLGYLREKGIQEGIWIRPKGKEKVSPLLFTQPWRNAFGDTLQDDIEAIAGLVDPTRPGLTPKYDDQFRASVAYGDIALMGRYAELKTARSEEPDPWVKVTVHTLNPDGKEVSGHDVCYVPFADADDDLRNKNHPFRSRFDRNSSPTTQKIKVSHYLIWADCDKRNAKRIPVTPGDDGESEKEIDVPVLR
jgi:hypothetical protein